MKKIKEAIFYCINFFVSGNEAIPIKKSKENGEVAVCEHNFDIVREYIGDTCWFNEIIKCTK